MNILLNTFQLITKLEKEIGHNVKIKFSVGEDALLIKADWWDDDFHMLQRVSEYQLMSFKSEDEFIEYLIYKFSNEHKNKVTT